MSKVMFAPLTTFADVTMGQSPGSELYNLEGKGLPFLQGCAEFGARNPQPTIYCNPPLRIAEAGSVLISVRAPVGTMNYAEQAYCIGRGLAAFRAKRDIANSVFLKHSVEQNANYLHRRSQGSTFAAVSAVDIKTVPVPAFDFPTQNKVARVFETIDGTIECTEALIEKYQQIKAGLMHDLFTRGIGTDGKLRPPREQAPELYQQTPIGWIPKDWKAQTLSSLSALITKGATPTTYGHEYVTESTEGCARFLRATNATLEGRYRDPDPRFISKVAHELLFRSQLEDGDTVISIVGANVGTSFSVNVTLLPGNINQNVALIRVQQIYALPSYISLCVASEFVQNAIANLVTTQAQPSLSLKQVGDLVIPLPALAEQAALVKVALPVGVRIESLTVEKAKLIEIKLGLMHDLLTGKVRVKLNEPSPEMAGG